MVLLVVTATVNAEHVVVADRHDGESTLDRAPHPPVGEDDEVRAWLLC